jgi:ABC-type transport system involved in multi-copper enzyme maturation permease subunit
VTSGTITPYRSQLPAGRDGFAQLLRAEWTKFRSVRSWIVGLAVAGLVTVLLGLLSVAGSHTSCGGSPGGPAPASACTPPLGPGGEAVSDGFFFVHQPLDGDGSITVRVTSLTGRESELEPWAKAGLIIKESTTQGSAYAAVMITGDHGVRMQYDYTHDTAGGTGAVSEGSPRWLRLTRSGGTLTGYESADGTHWTEVGTARLTGLASTVQAGLFVASPDHEEYDQSLGASKTTGGPTQATAEFDHVALKGDWPSGTWSGEDSRGGDSGRQTSVEAFQETGGTFTVSGSGNIAPALAAGGNTVEMSLVGAFAGLIAVIVVATMFVTAEYRRGLIRTTFAASPRRGRVLAAKAIVIGGVTFVAGLAASALAFSLVGRIRRDHGDVVLPVSSLTELRVVVGTAALLAVAAVIALAVGTVLRRSAGAVAAVIVLVVLPYILAVASVLPVGPGQWLLRITPAAAFAVQQSLPEYQQVGNAYTPANGYFPLAPWTGFAVLCVWTTFALALAVFLLNRRDA